MSWDKVQLRRVFRIVNGGTPTSDEQYWNGGIPWATPVDIGSVNGKYLYSTQRNLTAAGVHAGSRTVPDGSLILSTRAPIGYIAEAGRTMAFNQGCRGLVPTASADTRYFRYQLLALREELVSRGAGSTFMELSTDALAAVPVVRPSLDEQRRIADFLDAETAHIDRIVALRNFQVEKLSEALLCEARRVTGPEWKKVPLRRVVASVQTGTTPTDLLHPSAPGSIPWYTPAALGANLDLNDAEKSIYQEDVRQVPRFSAESILIVGIGESLGKVADLDHEATGNQQLTAIKISPNADRRFIAWRLFAAYEEIRAWAQYSRIRIINNDVLKSFTIPAPPIERQIEVRQQLDHRHTQLADFRDAATRFSQLAAERRKALITAAVTGQFDVTTAD